jgi:aspartate/methionine/tyrosine aminotransferase
MRYNYTIFSTLLPLHITHYSIVPMLKPNKEPANNTDPLLLLNHWAHHLNNTMPETNKQKMIFAGLGKPTYLLNDDIITASINYWKSYEMGVQGAKNRLQGKPLDNEETCESIVNAHAAIDYGLSDGDTQAKITMAEALSRWYETEIQESNLIFTVGGLHALKSIFAVINAKNPHGTIITPSPYYPFYNNPTHHNNLHLIDLMKEPGFRLTAKALENAISAVTKQNNAHDAISAFLFCDPNNPLGSVLGTEEWIRIANVLKTTHSHIPIILDEAYAEIVFNNKHVSLLHVAPELKDRIVVLRSGTKGFSASGERMAIVVCFNQKLKTALVDEVMLSYVHAPISLQRAYAHAMLNFSQEKRVALTTHYYTQMQFVQKQLVTLNVHIPHPAYSVEGTFYIVANLSELLYSHMADQTAKVFGYHNTLITTDVEICYSLLFQEAIMVAPLSFFGADPSLGYFASHAAMAMLPIKSYFLEFKKGLCRCATISPKHLAVVLNIKKRFKKNSSI